MQGFGASAYQKVAVQSGVQGADPHRLILMLFDGLLAAINEANGHLQSGRIGPKGAAVTKAIRIVEEGLAASLDRTAGGQLAHRLGDLYEYMTMRLLQANLRNDVSGLSEVAKLAGDLRDAWAQIGGKTSGAAPEAAPPAPHFFDGPDKGPVRRLTVSA